MDRELKRRRKRRKLNIDFWSKTLPAPPSDCLLWTGASHPFGYGCVRIDGRNALAHRKAWELTNGPIPEGMSILHSCDNPACVNPRHLSVGTQRQNVEDMFRRNRATRARGEALPFSKATESIVKAIRELCASGMSQRAAGRMFGIGKSQAQRIVARKDWRFVA